MSLSKSPQIDVKVCIGTTCYLLGGAELLELPKIPGVEITGMGCNNHCQKERPPIVSINGILFSEMTPSKLLEEIKSLQRRLNDDCI